MTTWISFEEWKAEMLNRMLPHGQNPITAETVRHGLHAERRPTALKAGFTKEQLRRTTKRQWKGLQAGGER